MSEDAWKSPSAETRDPSPPKAISITACGAQLISYVAYGLVYRPPTPPSVGFLVVDEAIDSIVVAGQKNHKIINIT
jgi:hypothetical protein